MAPSESVQPQVWTTGRLLTWTQEYLQRHGVDDGRLAAEILLAKALSCRRIELYTRFDRVPEPAQLDAYRDLVKQAGNHTPVAYLVGVKEFYSLEFEVSPAVLIPRPETEMLVEQVIDHCRRAGDRPWHILDVGTGSGCIAVSLAKHLPKARLVGTDVSAPALELAGRNAARHNLGERIRFLEVRGLQLGPDCRPVEGFDLIACNPPYVAAGEMADLPLNIREHEPRQALTDEADGLALYRELAEHGPNLLAAGGSVFVEIADGRMDAVVGTFAAGGAFELVDTWRDAGGVTERVIHVRWAG